MKSVVLSGVFVLASAGLALATQSGAETAAAVKPVTAAVEEAPAVKTGATPATGAARPLCAAGSEAALCAEVGDKS
jgi:hypothetical protein